MTPHNRTNRNCPAFCFVSLSLIKEVKISSMIHDLWSSWLANIYQKNHLSFFFKLQMKKRTLRINDKASNRRPLIADLPNVLITRLSFFPFPSPSPPASTTKNGPMAIYTTWIMIESDMATDSAFTRLLIRGRTDESAWKVSPNWRRCPEATDVVFLIILWRIGLWLRLMPVSADASTKG